MSTTTTTASARPLVETAEAISDLINEGTRLSMELLQTMCRNPMTMMAGQMLRNATPQLQKLGACSCHIPPPCWMPRALGEVVSHVCPGGTATIRIQVTNCGPNPRDIRVEPVGKPDNSPQIKVEPSSLALQPLQRGTFILSVPVPANANFGQEYEFLLYVRGCLDHYLRWTVRVAKRGVDCCHEVDVEDCPDYIHHWYDHFYCERPCLH